MSVSAMSPERTTSFTLIPRRQPGEKSHKSFLNRSFAVVVRLLDFVSLWRTGRGLPRTGKPDICSTSRRRRALLGAFETTSTKARLKGSRRPTSVECVHLGTPCLTFTSRMPSSPI